MDPLQQLNNQLRQAAHAEEVARRTATRRSPADGNEREQEAKIRAIVQQEVASALNSFTIQAGQRITISGTGRNMTISAQDNPPRTLSGTGICNDDGTITITIQG